ncbi:hypothetical protein [Nocardia sp. NPDC127526]
MIRSRLDRLRNLDPQPGGSPDPAEPDRRADQHIMSGTDPYMYRNWPR